MRGQLMLCNQAQVPTATRSIMRAAIPMQTVRSWVLAGSHSRGEVSLSCPSPNVPQQGPSNHRLLPCPSTPRALLSNTNAYKHSLDLGGCCGGRSAGGSLLLLVPLLVPAPLPLLLSLLPPPLALPPLPLSDEAQQGCSWERRAGSPSRRPAGCRRRAASGGAWLLVEASPPRLAVAASGGGEARWAAAPLRGAGSRRAVPTSCERPPQEVGRPLQAAGACLLSRVAMGRSGGCGWRCAAAQIMLRSLEHRWPPALRPGAGRRARSSGGSACGLRDAL